jgi:hypothetical protein
METNVMPKDILRLPPENYDMLGVAWELDGEVPL